MNQLAALITATECLGNTIRRRFVDPFEDMFPYQSPPPGIEIARRKSEEPGAVAQMLTFLSDRLTGHKLSQGKLLGKGVSCEVHACSMKTRVIKRYAAPETRFSINNHVTAAAMEVLMTRLLQKHVGWEACPHLFGGEVKGTTIKLQFERAAETFECCMESMGKFASVMYRLARMLSIAQRTIRFQHRDLSYNNVMLAREPREYVVCGDLTFRSYGVRPVMIDFGMSCAELNGQPVDGNAHPFWKYVDRQGAPACPPMQPSSDLANLATGLYWCRGPKQARAFLLNLLSRDGYNLIDELDIRHLETDAYTIGSVCQGHRFPNATPLVVMDALVPHLELQSV